MFSQPISKNIFETKTPLTYIAKKFDGLITGFENLFSIFPSTTYLDKNFDFDKLFEKLLSQFLSEYGAEGFSVLLLSIWTEIRSQPTFLKSFLRSPQLHSQKNRAFVNRIPKYSLFICILKLSHPNVFFFAYCVAIFTPSPNSHRKSKSAPLFSLCLQFVYECSEFSLHLIATGKAKINPHFEKFNKNPKIKKRAFWRIQEEARMMLLRTPLRNIVFI